MLERGDLTVVHEPFGDVIGLGETDVDGRPFRTAVDLLRWLREDTSTVDVLLKDTPNRRYTDLFADRRFLAEARHAFLIRRPDEIAASFYDVETTMDVDSIGLETLHRLYRAVIDAGAAHHVVLDSDDLVTRPAATIAAYCAAVGLPFLAHALTWDAGERHEWRRSERWHRAVSTTTGFVRREQEYVQTVETSSELARFAAHHQPFYELLHAQRLDVTPFEADQ